MLCGIVLSRLTHRAKTLIIAGLCIEWVGVGGEGLSEWRWWGSLEGVLGSLCWGAGWATEGRWRETSPMTMQPQCCYLTPEKVVHRHGIGLRTNKLHFHCSARLKKKKRLRSSGLRWLVGLLAGKRSVASRWPRFVELAWGLGFGTLFSGNGGVNTKGLVAKGCFIDSEFVCECSQSGGGRGITKLTDGLDNPWSLPKKQEHFAVTSRKRGN